jgi:hypothetical protein
MSNAFVQRLIQQQIPFEKNQLERALQILGEAPKKVEASRVLSEMILRRLPMTNRVFEALVQVQQSGLGEQMNQLNQVLQKESKSRPLSPQLQFLLGHNQQETNTLIYRHIAAENQQNAPSLFLLLKASGSIPQDVNFQTWKSSWGSFLQREMKNAPDANQIRMPFQLTTGAVQNVLEQTVQNRNALSANAAQFIRQWEIPIQQVMSNKQSFTPAQRQQITEQMTKLLKPLNPSITKQTVKQSVNFHQTDLNEILLLARVLEGGQALRNADQLLTLIQHRNRPQDPFLNPNLQFLDQVRFMLASFGLSYEHDLLHEKYDQPTVKEILLQLVQEKDGVVRKQALQFLNYLNGMQLNSVEETENFIRASLLLPGERLQLESDLRLDFDGRKKDNGEISTDFCRILFYLTLSSLGETVIDMNVQNRNVHITVYNDNEINSALFERFKPQLKNGLEQLNYHFSGITLKPIENKEVTVMDHYRNSITDNKGVDFRI